MDDDEAHDILEFFAWMDIGFCAVVVWYLLFLRPFS